MARRRKITAGIPLFNSAGTIRRVIDGVMKQSHPLDEIIVVDDGSTDGGAAQAMSPYVRLITHNRNRGLAEARNTIVESAENEIVVFFDADAVPEKRCVEMLAKHFRDPKVGAVGGKGVEDQRDNMATRWRARITPQDHGDIPIRDDWMLMGLCFAFRKSIVKKIGGFDSNFQAAGEDVDICLRIRKAGYRLVYEPAAVVRHYPGGGMVSVTRQAMRHAKYATYALAKNGESQNDYLRDTYTHLTTSAVRDLKKGRYGDSIYCMMNMAARTVGIIAGKAKAKGEIFIKPRL